MDKSWSHQYRCPCVIYDGSATADTIIERCQEVGAVFYEDGPDDECYVVQIRPDIGPEIWTASALKRGL